MNNYKKLINNSIIFAIGNMGSKVITFVMLPLYTYALSTEEYGTVDLLLTTISLLLPIVGLSVFESVLRFAMEKNRDPESVFSNSMYVTLLSSLLLLFTIPFAMKFENWIGILPILLIIQLFQNLFSQYAKAINKINIFAMNGILLSFFTAGLNIIFLVPFKMGLHGYLLSLVFANIISTVYLSVRLDVPKIYNRKKVNSKDIIDQLRFCIPLIPNSIAWWLTTAVGRYFILIFIGMSANGIFAVSNKIPTLLVVFTSIFAQSWQISAIESYENEDGKEILNNVYNYYFFLLFLSSSFLILFIRPMMKILVSPEFFSSWKYVPFLLLSVIFSSISGFLGSQYIAMKDSVGVFKTTIIGAVLNVILNLVLIPIIGLQGVGVSSFLSFFIVWLIRHNRINKLYNLELNIFKLIVLIFLLVLQGVLSICNLNIIFFLLQILILFIIIFINKENMIVILSVLKKTCRKLARKLK